MDDEKCLSKRISGLGELHLLLSEDEEHVIQAQIIYDEPRPVGGFINEGMILSRSPMGGPSRLEAVPTVEGTFRPKSRPCGGRKN